MRWLLIICLVIGLTGCRVVVRSSDNVVPDTVQELEEFIASKEAEIEGLEYELVSAEEARDIYSKHGEGIALDNSITDISWLKVYITQSQQALAKAKVRLSHLQESANDSD